MNRKKPHQGFTLIELLLAMAIATVLMIGLLTVIALSARDRLRMKSLDVSTGNDVGGLVRLITKDLASARIAKPLNDETGIVIDGFCTIDRSTHLRSCRPVEIVYQVQQGQPNVPHFIIRRQRYLDEQISSKPWSETVCDGIRLLSIQTAMTPTEVQAAKKLSVNTGELGREVELNLAFDDLKRSEINPIIVLH